MASILLRYLVIIIHLIIPLQQKIHVASLDVEFGGETDYAEMRGLGDVVNLDAGRAPFDVRQIGLTFDATQFDNDTVLLYTVDVQQKVWVRAIRAIHTALASVGIAANLVTIVTISRNGREFSMVMRALLKHQALVDGLACVIAVLTSLQPRGFWKMNIEFVDYIACIVWHSEAIYWAVIMVSIWNLVLMAVERYTAVLHPHKHRRVIREHILGVFCVLYLCFATHVVVSGFAGMKYLDGVCYTVRDRGFPFYWAVTNMFIFYIIPMVCFNVLYSRIIFALRSRNNPQSDIIDAASVILLRMAIAVTAVFAGAIGYAQCYFTLVYTGVIPYVINSPQETAAIVLNTCNVVANPFVYGFMLPAFRRSLKDTFHFLLVWQNRYRVNQTTATLEMTRLSRTVADLEVRVSTIDIESNTNDLSVADTVAPT